MNCAGIYLISNLVTGRVYVGSSRNVARRFGEHKTRLKRGAHINSKLQASWNKHGQSAFEFSIIASVLDVTHIESLEQHFIDSYDAVSSGYNLSPVAGNTAGWRANDEQRANMSRAAKLRDHSVQVAAMANATKGRKRPAHVIEAMQLGRKAKGLSDESRERMSASAKARGCTMSADGLARAIAGKRAKRKLSDDQQGEMSAMRERGATLKEIGDAFGITAETTVHANIKAWRARTNWAKP